MIGGGGIIYYSIEKFGRPFFCVEERSFSISHDQPVQVSSDKLKIICILDGESSHTIDGVQKGHIRKGDILIAPRSIVQTYSPLPKQDTARIYAFLLFFDPQFLPLLKSENASSLRSSSSERIFTDFVRHYVRKTQLLEDILTPSMRELINEVRKEAKEKSIGYRHRIQALCQNLVVTIIRASGKTPHTEKLAPSKSSSHFHHDLVESTKEYIFRHLSQEITLEQIAWSQHKSSEHLARVFKSVTGQTVFAYIREARLEQAKIYLRDTRRTLTEIATLTGFSSLSYFSRTFQQSSGITPTQYRKETVVEQTLISEERRKKP